MIVPASNYDLWWEKSIPLTTRALNLRCLEVPDAILNTYLAEECDGAVCHLFHELPVFGQGSGCKQSKSLLNLIKLLSPRDRVSKAMIGNQHKPFMPPTNGIFVTLQYDQLTKIITAKAYIAKENFCTKLCPGTVAGLAEQDVISLDAHDAIQHPPPQLQLRALDGSQLVPHQTQLLQSMWQNECSTLAPLLWFPQDDKEMQVSKICDIAVRMQPPMDSGISGGVVSMPICSGKSRVVAALTHLLFDANKKTLIVIKSDYAAWHWINEFSVYGINCEFITDANTPCTSSVCVATWNTIQTSNRPWFVHRVVYDDLLRYASKCSPIVATCVWGLVTPDQLHDGKRKFSSIIRFMFSATVQHQQKSECLLAGGIIARICTCADAEAEHLARDLQPILILKRSSTQIIREQEKQTIVFEPTHAWAAEYRACRELIERSRAQIPEKMMGTIAGNSHLYFDSLFSQPSLPEDYDSCSICSSVAAEMNQPVQLPCGHFFCYACIMQWFAELATKRQLATCPCCRAEFTPESIVSCRPPRPVDNINNKPILKRNTEKLDCIVQTCLHRLRFPRARILLLSRFANVRKTLLLKLQEHVQQKVTTDRHRFFSSLSKSDVTDAASILIASPSDLLQLRIMGQANVVIFAEPCVDKALAETICKQLTLLDGHHEVSVLTVVTAGTHEVQLCNGVE